MTILNSFRTVLQAVAMLSLALVVRGNGANFIMDGTKSHVDVAVKSTLGSFDAKLEKYDVAITFDSDKVGLRTAVFHADLAALKTVIADRDNNMRVWLQADAFPQVAFELRALDRGPDGALTARGRFQLHGRMHEIHFPVTMSVTRGLVVIDGTATLDTQDFGLPIIRFWVLTVDPVVNVQFHLQGSLTR
jgi:polyisoprenoid-binding protein YceI